MRSGQVAQRDLDDLVAARVDGRQGGQRVAGLVDVVEADDGDVLRDAAARPPASRAGRPRAIRSLKATTPSNATPRARKRRMLSAPVLRYQPTTSTTRSGSSSIAGARPAPAGSPPGGGSPSRCPASGSAPKATSRRRPRQSRCSVAACDPSTLRIVTWSVGPSRMRSPSSTIGRLDAGEQVVVRRAQRQRAEQDRRRPSACAGPAAGSAHAPGRRSTGRSSPTGPAPRRPARRCRRARRSRRCAGRG